MVVQVQLEAWQIVQYSDPSAQLSQIHMDVKTVWCRYTQHGYNSPAENGWRLVGGCSTAMRAPIGAVASNCFLMNSKQCPGQGQVQAACLFQSLSHHHIKSRQIFVFAVLRYLCLLCCGGACTFACVVYSFVVVLCTPLSSVLTKD